MNEHRKGAALVVLSAFGFGFLPVFAIFAYKGNITVTTLLVIRFLIAAGVLLIFAFMKYGKIDLTKRDLLYLLILGGVGYNLQARFYFSSVKYISSSLAALFLYTYPVIVSLLSFILDKERMSKQTGISIAVCFAGLAMILCTSIGSINGVGIILALGSALVYSTYIIFGNRMLKRTPPLLTSAFIALFSAVGVFVTGAFTEGISFHFKLFTWLPILGLVLLSTVMSMLFFFRGMELLGPTKSSIISMTEPMFTVILSAILLHDHLTLIQFAGGIVVLAGSILVIMSREQNKYRNVNLTQHNT